MVMQAYDVSVNGSQHGRDNGSTATRVVMSRRVALSNITSARNPKPYRAYSPHGYLKVIVVKLDGWSSYRQLVPGGYFLEWTGTSGDYSAQMVFDPLNSARATAFTESYNKVVSKLNDHIRGSTDLSVDTLQGGQAWKMAKDVARVVQLTNSYRKNPARLLKDVKRLTSRKALTGAGDTWLAYVYGIKPLMSSIYDACNHSSHHYNNEFSFAKARASSKFDGRADNTGAQWPDYTYQTSWQGQGLARTEIGMVLRIPDSPLTNVARLSSLNPVSMAWELMPWSFVVDWFFNIGGYLRDLETAVTYSSYFVRGYKSNSHLTAYDFVGVRNYRTSAEYYGGSWGLHIERREMSRSVLSSYPFPSRPVFQCNLGSGRLLNAAALLSQVLKPSRGITAGVVDLQCSARS